MATLPNVFSQRPVPNPSRPMAGIQSAGAVANAVQGLGQQANLLGMQILDREATAAAKDADTAAADRIRALLYDPETGFANMQGSAAVNARQRVSEQLDAIMASSLEGLSGAARRKAEDSLRSRVERGKMTIDTHTSDQRNVWIDGAREARIESSYQDILANPGVANEELLRIEGEIRGEAEAKGWSAEQTELELLKRRSSVYSGVADQIALVDPEGAAAYLQENRANMLGSDVVALEAKLIPMAKDAEGRRLGLAALNGNNGYAPPADDVAGDTMRALGKGDPIASGINEAAAALGVSPLDLATAMSYETRGSMNPLQGGPTTQWGTHRGLIQFGEPQAEQYGVDWNNPVTSQLGANGAVVKYLKDHGVKPGMGLIDIYSAINAGGVGRYNASDANNGGAPGTVADKVAGMGVHRDKAAALLGWEKTSGGSDITALLDIADPRVRAAAFEEYQLQATVRAGEAKAVKANAANAAFALVESGGSVGQLTVDQRVAIGEEGMSSLRTYEAKVRAGIPIETDMGIYAALRRQAVTDPSGFRDAYLPLFADKLSKSDLKGLIDMQTNPVDSAGAMSASSLMSVATAQLRGLEIKAGDPREAVVQTGLLKWQDAFFAKEKRYPAQLEIDQQVGKMLMEVVIDPPGVFGYFSGKAFEIGQPMDVGGVTVPADVVNEQVNLMIAEGLEVNYDTLTARIQGLMQ